MTTRVHVLALLAGVLLAVGPRPSFAQQAPEGCDVPAADLEPPDIPEGYSGVVRIVIVNGRYNRGLSTGSASAAAGTPVPFSVARYYQWGPDCSGQVRFVFLVEPEEEEGPGAGAGEGGLGGEIGEDWGSQIGAAWTEALEGEAGAAGGPQGGGGQEEADAAWEDLVDLLVLAEEDFAGCAPADPGECPPPPDPEAGQEPATAEGELPPMEIKPVGPTAPSGPELPHGEPPDCDEDDLTNGVWSIVFYITSVVDSRVRVQGRTSGALTNAIGLWERTSDSETFEPVQAVAPMWLFFEGEFLGMTGRGRNSWDRAVVTIQYTCEGQTWVVQYEATRDKMKDFALPQVEMRSANRQNP